MTYVVHFNKCLKGAIYFFEWTNQHGGKFWTFGCDKHRQDVVDDNTWAIKRMQVRDRAAYLQASGKST